MISGYAPADPNRAARLPASAAATWLRTDYGWLINTLPNLNKMQSTRHNMYIYIYYRIFMLIACAKSFWQMFHVWLHLLVSFLSLNASGLISTEHGSGHRVCASPAQREASGMLAPEAMAAWHSLWCSLWITKQLVNSVRMLKPAWHGLFKHKICVLTNNTSKHQALTGTN